MKADRYAKDVFKTLEDLSNSGRISINIKNSNVQNEDYGTDEYYIRIGERPPRFQLYQQARWEKLDECQCVDDFITLDELDFILKQQLAMSPEARYPHRRNKGEESGIPVILDTLEVTAIPHADFICQLDE